MVKLNIAIFKYLTIDDFRVLLAIELGMRNHEFVPTDLIESIARLKRVNIHKVLMNLLKNKLIHHNGQKYSGFCLNYLGYDFLAIRSLLKKGILVKILTRMGVGKESDVYFCLINPDAGKEGVKELSEEEIAKVQMNLLGKDLDDEINDNKKTSNEDLPEIEEDEESENLDNKNEKEFDEEESKEDDENIGNDEFSMFFNKEEDFNEEFYIKNFENYNQLEQLNSDKKCKLIPGILKLARLGRTSFRAIKSKRDFVNNKNHYNWLYLSRLSAQTEFKFLKGLYNEKFPVPKPYGNSRHATVMEYISSYQLSKVVEISNPEKVYNILKSLIYKLAENGLVHGDFNEFNVLIDKNENVTMIDFTQMISIDHSKAEEYFNRDLKGVRNFFRKKFLVQFEENDIPFEEISNKRISYLDVLLTAFGSKKKLDNSILEEINSKNNNLNSNVDKDDELEDLEFILNKNSNEINKSNLNDISISLKDTKSEIMSKKDITKKVMKDIGKQLKQQNKCKNRVFKSKKDKKTNHHDDFF